MTFARQIFRCVKIIGVAAVALVLLTVLSYIGLVSLVWLRDTRTPIPPPQVGKTDFGRLTSASSAEVIVPDSDKSGATLQLQELVKRAAAEGRKISIAGSQHSMGGHTLFNGGLRVEMRCPAFSQISRVTVQNNIATVRVGAGATWHELLATLDQEGWSVAVMQSNDDFTIGGSVSVNCHGWEPNAQSIASTVEGFTLLSADGSVIECRRDRPADRELFGAVCGGYGLLGIILEVELRVVPNVLYKAQEFSATAKDYAAQFDSLSSSESVRIGLMYGRISISPGPWFLNDARIIRFTVSDDKSSGVKNSIRQNGGSFGITNTEIAMARAVFRASAGSDFGKLGRWTIERLHGQTHRIVSRNGILRTPSEWFADHDPNYLEILHEYFVPPDRLAEFLARAKPMLQRTNDIDLLNVTIRKVKRDDITMLSYARGDVFGLVMLFRYPANHSSDSKMGEITRALIATALDCDGSYYLPYRPHATPEQFHQAYPRFAEFYQLKIKRDPGEVFQNIFYLNYIRPTKSDAAP